MGKGTDLIRATLRIDTDDCIEWPMARHPAGYGKVADGADVRGAHRVMCELAHGPAPTPEHEAAHSCGNRPCFNKAHLSWKTHADNQADMVAHGTSLKGSRHHRAKLVEADIPVIRALLAAGESHGEIAARFVVARQTITNISMGIRWA